MTTAMLISIATITPLANFSKTVENAPPRHMANGTHSAICSKSNHRNFTAVGIFERLPAIPATSATNPGRLQSAPSE